MTVTCSSNEKPWPWLEKPTTEVFFYVSEHVLMCYGIVQEEKQKHCVIYEISTTLSIIKSARFSPFAFISSLPMMYWNGWKELTNKFLVA